MSAFTLSLNTLTYNPNNVSVYFAPAGQGIIPQILTPLLSEVGGFSLSGFATDGPFIRITQSTDSNELQAIVGGKNALAVHSSYINYDIEMTLRYNSIGDQILNAIFGEFSSVVPQIFGLTIADKSSILTPRIYSFPIVTWKNGGVVEYASATGQSMERTYTFQAQKPN